MRVLLDTNILLDLFLDREPFAEDAATLWQANAKGRIVYWSQITHTKNPVSAHLAAYGGSPVIRVFFSFGQLPKRKKHPLSSESWPQATTKLVG